jgi:hypothetical protein
MSIMGFCGGGGGTARCWLAAASAAAAAAASACASWRSEELGALEVDVCDRETRKKTVRINAAAMKARRGFSIVAFLAFRFDSKVASTRME